MAIEATIRWRKRGVGAYDIVVELVLPPGAVTDLLYDPTLALQRPGWISSLGRN